MTRMVRAVLIAVVAIGFWSSVGAHRPCSNRVCLKQCKTFSHQCTKQCNFDCNNVPGRNAGRAACRKECTAICQEQRLVCEGMCPPNGEPVTTEEPCN